MQDNRENGISRCGPTAVTEDDPFESLRDWEDGERMILEPEDLPVLLKSFGGEKIFRTKNYMS